MPDDADGLHVQSNGGIRLRIPDSRVPGAALTALLALAAWHAAAAEVQLIGVFPGKAAILAIDGGAPRTVRIGQQLGPVRVLGVERERAEVEIEGKRRVLALGQYQGQGGSAGGRQSITLAADARGHFLSDGTINGGSVRFMVDTGATVISIPASDASRLGLDYRKGRRVQVQTANGVAPAWLVQLDAVRVGGVELNGVQGVVVESGMEFVLLGMSFLNRFDMRRDGDTMTLTKRF
jgi:aspartyl protease family protein